MPTGDVTVQMPTDLRSRVSPLDVDPPLPKSNGIIKFTVDVPAPSKLSEEYLPPSRWKTPEFIFYIGTAVVVVPIMVWIPVTLSSTSHPNYPFYHARLSPGWLFGREVDNSDRQYRSFRNNIPSLALLAGSFLALKALYTKTCFRPLHTDPRSKLYLIPFLLAFSILMLLGLHGASILKIFAILIINYTITKYWRGAKLGPILTWLFNGAILFANDRNSGYRFANIHPALDVLDAYQGIYPRWHVSFNITMLRLVSFSVDYYWACSNSALATTDGVSLSWKQRKSTSHPQETYSFMNYIAYVLYPPLYIAGPIITFNDFMWQVRQPDVQQRLGVRSYLIRFLSCLLTMEFILHFMYVVAIKDSKAWPGDTPAELSMIGLWNLFIVWLKLLLPWRFFRLWALADGIDPPENMIRCVANNYSTMGFWRSWHRSYNLWVVRYIYIPLGGTKNVVITTVLVFSFVALWHDLSFKLLAWGWLVSLFILPEMVAGYLLPASTYGQRPWFRHVCAIGAVANILMMMTANLVGFVVGMDGMSYFVKELIGTSEGLQFLVGACVCLFIAAHLMFEYRAEEMRHGIYRRC